MDLAPSEPGQAEGVQEEHVGGGLLEQIEQVVDVVEEVAAGRLQEALLPHHLLHESGARHLSPINRLRAFQNRV